MPVLLLCVCACRESAQAPIYRQVKWFTTMVGRKATVKTLLAVFPTLSRQVRSTALTSQPCTAASTQRHPLRRRLTLEEPGLRRPHHTLPAGQAGSVGRGLVLRSQHGGSGRH